MFFLDVDSVQAALKSNKDDFVSLLTKGPAMAKVPRKTTRIAVKLKPLCGAPYVVES